MVYNQFGSDISWSRVFVMTLFITLAISISPTIAQQKLKKPKTKSLKMKWMDTIQIQDTATKKKSLLTVYQVNPLHRPLTHQEETKQFNEFLKELKKAENEEVSIFAENTFSYQSGNCAFVVVKSQKINKGREAKRQVAGLVYASLSPIEFRHNEQLSSKLVWNRAKESLYLVVAMKTGGRTTIAIAPIDPQKKVGTLPLEFPPLKAEKWIKPVKLLAELNTEIGISYISSMDVISDRDTILIAVHSVVSDAKGKYLRYDLTKDQWKKVEVSEGTIIKTKSKKKIKK